MLGDQYTGNLGKLEWVFSRSTGALEGRGTHRKLLAWYYGNKSLGNENRDVLD